MFADKDISLFYNPIYEQECPDTLLALDVQPHVSDLQLWSQCYFRFVPLLEIVDGGKPKVNYFYNKNSFSKFGTVADFTLPFPDFVYFSD
jgi:hypothetical protein